MRKIVIGDVQGCLDELKALLDLLDFKSSSDQLIFLGDLINRGPKSLEVLEFLYLLIAVYQIPLAIMIYIYSPLQLVTSLIVKKIIQSNQY